MVEDLVTEWLSAALGDADNPHAWAHSSSLLFTRLFTGVDSTSMLKSDTAGHFRVVVTLSPGTEHVKISEGFQKGVAWHPRYCGSWMFLRPCAQPNLDREADLVCRAERRRLAQPLTCSQFFQGSGEQSMQFLMILVLT